MAVKAGQPSTRRSPTDDREVEHLRRLVEQYEDIIRSLPVGLIFIDDQDRVAIANPLGAEIRCVGDRVGGPVSECHPPNAHTMLDKVLCRFRETPPEEQHPIVMERMQRYEVTYSRVSDRDGGYRGVLWLAQDISRRKQLERELLHAERLAGLGRMAAKLAHDIKNPLNVIQGAAHYLENGGEPSSDGQGEMTGLIKEQVRRISRLVQRLNTLTRPFDLKLEPRDLGDAVRKQMQACSAAHPGVRWSVHVADDLPEVPCDENLLARLVCNAGENAAHAMQGEGELQVEVGLRTAADGTWAVITFRDEGPGFPDEVLENLYQPFVTTRPDGSGLGLTIMREICLLHGGELHVENGDAGAVVRAELSTR